jgi:hypothetical protein
MRMLLGLGAFFAIAILALVGFVVMKESRREPASGATSASATELAIDTISHGDRVDIAAAIPNRGYVVVEFEADF